MAEPTQIALPYRGPYPVEPVFGFLAARAVPGLETVEDLVYRRTTRIGSGHATIEVAGGDAHLTCCVAADGEAAGMVERCRAMFDLDADTERIASVLARTPELSGMVNEVPGRRVVGSIEGFEMVIRALLGQQVSVSGARTTLGRLVERFGDPIASEHGLTHVFPTPERLAEESLDEVRVPDLRRQAIRSVSRLIAEGDLRLDPEADREEARGVLMSIPGIGPWTAAYVSMRALRDPDVFMATDLGVRKGAEKLGLPTSKRELERVAEAWRPFRSYATQYLWAAAA